MPPGRSTMTMGMSGALPVWMRVTGFETFVLGAEAAREEGYRRRFLDEDELAREEVAEVDELLVGGDDGCWCVARRAGGWRRRSWLRVRRRGVRPS